jgi:hypothetical protein
VAAAFRPRCWRCRPWHEVVLHFHLCYRPAGHEKLR